MASSPKVETSPATRAGNTIMFCKNSDTTTNPPAQPGIAPRRQARRIWRSGFPLSLRKCLPNDDTLKTSTTDITTSTRRVTGTASFNDSTNVLAMGSANGDMAACYRLNFFAIYGSVFFVPQIFVAILWASCWVRRSHCSMARCTKMHWFISALLLTTASASDLHDG